ncbi:MAG: ATP-binding cassette domain-containing protein [Cytophagales bacterium]|nr:ATP-binding cassette domain-containing protein [Cytophagales bacterium]
MTSSTTQLAPSILQINQLSKNFGRIQAVNSLELNVRKGQVYGILGPNGSGKTTTLGMILDVVAPSSGSFSWFEGKSPEASRKLIGSILETPCFYPYLTPVQNLRIVANIKGCGYDRIETVLEQVNLLDRKNDKFKSYSLGMKQRLSIAAALLSDPPVLIFDEPTNGLDPQGIAEIRELIGDVAAQGKTIIMASHLLDEVQKVCTDFCVLKKGVKLHEGPVQDILGETNQVEIASADPDALTTLVETYKGVHSIETINGSELKVTLHPDFKSADLNQYCFEQQHVLTKVNPLKNSLEQEFLKILEESENEAK